MIKFAVIRTGGKQYLVKSGNSLKVEKLAVQPDKSIIFDDVLLVVNDDGSDIEIGKPRLASKVTAKLLQHGRAKKVVVVHYKPKVRYHKKYGHRQPYSEVRMDRIG